MDNLELDPRIRIGMERLAESCEGIFEEYQQKYQEEKDAEYDDCFGEEPMPEKSKVKILLDDVWALSDDERNEFIEQFAATSLSEDAFLFLRNLDLKELTRFNQWIKDDIGSRVIHTITKSVAEQLKGDSKVDLDLLIAKAVEDTEAYERLNSHVWMKVALRLFCEQQFRGPSPENIQRNYDICVLNATGDWTQGQLAKKYNFKQTSSIRGILKKENKWRLLHRQMERDAREE
jgi:hypothetical protein